jgi:hypothetical protein
MPDEPEIAEVPGAQLRAARGSLVFISASSKDYALAGQLYEFLVARGIRVFFSKRTLEERGRSNFRREIDQALEEAGHMIVVASDRSNLESRWVEAEWGMFDNDLRSGRKSGNLITLVRAPLKLGDLPISLRNHEVLDFGPQEFEKVCKYVAQPARVDDAKPPDSQPRPPMLWGAIAVALLLALGTFILIHYLNPPERPRGDVLRSSAPPTSSLFHLAWPRYHALVIGIDEYESAQTRDWSNLKTARSDAETLAKVLEQRYGFQVKRLLDRGATRGTIIAQLDALTHLTEDDAALVFFAGHGLYDETLKEGYWIPCDARKTAGGRSTKEDWIWNSTVTKILGASPARQVLVIADACFGGSLSVGGSDAKAGARTPAWYQREVSRPARFLIASGGLEPVADGTEGHSVFAEHLLQCLDAPNMDMIAATEIGLQLREMLQSHGQMVQMGPLNVPEHSGGDFVFIRKDASLLRDAASARPASSASPPLLLAEPDATALLQQAILLGNQGATNAARQLLALAGAKGGGDKLLVQAVSGYLDDERRARSRAEVRLMLSTIESQAKMASRTGSHPGSTDQTRPRVVACFGPVASSANAETEGRALLTRAVLRTELDQVGACQVVEREALEQVLQEMNLASSSLSDPRSRELLGKLMPASLLLLGDLLPVGENSQLLLRLVETETSRILKSFSVSIGPGDALAATCVALASNIVTAAVLMKPLEARVLKVEGDRLTALLGSWHGARSATKYSLIERLPSIGDAAPVEHLLGEVTLTGLGNKESEFQIEKTLVGARTAQTGQLLVREQVK